jgi:hypothetical protein
LTPPTRAATVKCRRCRKEFAPVKGGHVFCSAACRHRRERRPDAPPVDEEQVARLFDPSRDPGERVRADDWCNGMDAERTELYSVETVGQRRGWYLRLVDIGRI